VCPAGPVRGNAGSGAKDNGIRSPNSNIPVASAKFRILPSANEYRSPRKLHNCRVSSVCFRFSASSCAAIHSCACCATVVVEFADGVNTGVAVERGDVVEAAPDVDGPVLSPPLELSRADTPPELLSRDDGCPDESVLPGEADACPRDEPDVCRAGGTATSA